MKRRAVFLLVSVAVLCLFLVPLRYRATRSIERQACILGTIVEIRVSGFHDTAVARRAVDEALKEIRRIDEAFSMYKPGSTVSRINTLKVGVSLVVDDETLSLLERSRYWNGRSSGAFDITIKPLKELWVSAGKKGSLPGKDEIDNALAAVGQHAVIIDAELKTIRLAREGVAIDLGGIAKGYAVDRAIDILKRYGIGSAIVVAGGDLFCLGRRDVNHPWKLAIRDPVKKDHTVAEFTIEDRAVSTSGGYERFTEIGERRFSHIIDPKTGMPLEDGPASVTIIARRAIDSDALATGVSVLGVQRGMELVNELEGVDAVIITNEAGALRFHSTRGMKERYGLTKK